MDPVTLAFAVLAAAAAACGGFNKYYPEGDDDAGVRDDAESGRSDAAVQPHIDATVPDAEIPAADATTDMTADDGQVVSRDAGELTDGPSFDESLLPDDDAGAADATSSPDDLGPDAFATTPPSWENFTCKATYSANREIYYGMKMSSAAPSYSERNHFIGAARFAASAGTDTEAEAARQSRPAGEWECDACSIPDYARNLTGIYYITGSFEGPDSLATANLSIVSQMSGGASSAAIFPMTPCADPACEEIEPIDPAYTNEIYPAYDHHHPVRVEVECASDGESCASFAGETILDNGETFRLECGAE